MKFIFALPARLAVAHLSPPPLAGEGQGGGRVSMDSTKTPTWKVGTLLRKRARRRRRDSTDAERIMWSALRAHRLNGESFRRQAPIGPYVADFVCHRGALIVEIDGGQHFEAGQEQRDTRRTAHLEAKGYRVLRFSNLDVIENRQGVLEAITAALAASPSPPLPRKRGRESAGVGA